MISLTDFFGAASRRHNDVILLPAIRRVSGNDSVFQQDSAPTHCVLHMQQLNCCIKKRQTFVRPTCGLQTAQISVLWITRSGLLCSIMSTADKSIVWMNWNSDSSMSGAVLNSRFSKTSSVCPCYSRAFRVQPVNWRCWFCPYLLYSNFHVTCLTVTS